MSGSTIEDDLAARLRDYGRILERELEGASPVEVIHHPVDQRRQAGLVAVAATVLLLAGTAALARIGSSDVEVPTAPVTAVSPSPGAEPEPTAEPSTVVAPTLEQTRDGIEGCTHWVEEVRSKQDQLGFDPFDGLFDPRTGTLEALVLSIADSPGAQRVLLRGNDGFYTCRVSRSGAPLAGANHGTAEQMARPEPDRLRLLDRSDSSPQSAAGGFFAAFGRAGTEVQAVWAELPDGTIAAGVLTESGWFTIEGDLGRGDHLSAERYVWSLRDGSTRFAMAGGIAVQPSQTDG